MKLPSELPHESRALTAAAGLDAAGPTPFGASPAEALRSISARHGIDVATAFLFDHVRHSSRHAAFIARIDDLQRECPTRTFPRDLIVGIIPAAFYREMPHTGADGRVLRQTAAALGLRAELVPISSTGTLAENATAILAWMRRKGDRPIVLVSLCKGGADLKHALHHAAPSFRSAVAWINVCGTLDGSPFAAWLLASKPRFIATWLYFKCHRRNFTLLREIVPTSAGPLAHPLVMPAHLRFISVIGFPLRRHLTNGFMRRCHGFIAPAGPNDGGVLLADALQWPGLLYPVWGADHYLRPDARAGAVLAAILRYLAETLSFPAIGTSAVTVSPLSR